MAQITIFHTSDMHDKLTAPRGEFLLNLKNKYPDSIFLDSGDAIGAGNIYWKPGGERIFNLMNKIGYTAMCVGNREYHFMAMGMKSKLGGAEFPVLSSNLKPAQIGTQLPTQPYMFIEKNGIKICVFGLSVPCITEQMMVKKISDYYFIQPIDAAQKMVDELRDKCDLLIAITHIGIKKDIELAEKVSGIDMIFGGHTHTITEEPVNAGSTTILHSGCFAKLVRKNEIEFLGGKSSIKTELISIVPDNT